MGEGRGTPSDDVALVHELVRGSEAALATLYDRYGDAIFASAYRLTADRGIAEEVVQETFLTLWNRAELFDPAAGSLPAWLHAIGRNRAVDRLRAAGRRPHLVAMTQSGAPDESETQALERAMAGGTVVAGAVQPPGPEESADALYGVTVGDDSVSRVISLRLDEAQAIADRRSSLWLGIGTISVNDECSTNAPPMTKE